MGRPTFITKIIVSIIKCAHNDLHSIGHNPSLWLQYTTTYLATSLLWHNNYHFAAIANGLQLWAALAKARYDTFTTSSIPNWVVIEVDIVNYYDKLEYPNYDGKDDLMDSMEQIEIFFSKDTTEEGNKVFLAAYAILLAIPNSRRLNREFCS